MLWVEGLEEKQTEEMRGPWKRIQRKGSKELCSLTQSESVKGLSLMHKSASGKKAIAHKACAKSAQISLQRGHRPWRKTR